MAPTESTLLHTFLLPPAPLPTILPLKSFTDLFPPSAQKNPAIRTLYRNLQHARALITDTVAQNIEVESRRGDFQRRNVVRTRRRAERERNGGDEEVLLENAVRIFYSFIL